MKKSSICSGYDAKMSVANLLGDRTTYIYLIVIIYVVILTNLLTEIKLTEETHSRSVASLGSHRIKPCTYAYFDDTHQVLTQDGETGYQNKSPTPVVSSVVQASHRTFWLQPSQLKFQPKEEVASQEKGAEDQLPGVGNTTARDGVWQTVGATRFKFFVFSAYYDSRRGPIVRVIGATKTVDWDKVWCRLWYHNATYPNIVNHSISVAGRVKIIRENWRLQYSACFVLCLLKRNQSVPSSVSIVITLNRIPTNRMIIHQYRTVQPPHKMAACVKPLHYDYNKSLSMVEFIELNRLLGIEHIYFYNNTVSPSTSCVLEAYASEGRVTVLPWRLKIVSQKQIRTEGMYAAFNDCLYRSMYSYSHVVFIDLDEFIMPQHNETLFELIKWIEKQWKKHIIPRIAAYYIQNAFFYLQWSDDTITQTASDPFQSNLVTLRKTRRRATLQPHRTRSKYICRPEYIVEAGNHIVWEFIPGYRPLEIEGDMAILNHYRVCERGGDDCVTSESVVDRTAFRYRDRLVKNVGERWDSVVSKCNLPEVTMKPPTSPPPDIITTRSASRYI